MVKAKILIIIVGILLITISSLFMFLYFRDDHTCKEGSNYDELIVNNIVYVECHQKGKSESYKVIENEQIVRKAKIIQNESTYLITFNKNWTDKGFMVGYGMLSVLGMVVGILGISHVNDICEILPKRKKE